MPESVSTQIQTRLESAGLGVTTDQLRALNAYFGLLTKWNKTVNLTSLELDPPSEETLDRLLIEPLLAAGHVRKAFAASAASTVAATSPSDGPLRLLDVGSGGGSPAILIGIGLGPGVEVHMVESRGRKAAFLREAVRELHLDGAQVHQARLEALLSEAPMHEAFDVVSIRAVRADQGLWNALSALVRPRGVVLWFRSASEALNADSGFSPHFMVDAVHELIARRGSELTILRKY